MKLTFLHLADTHLGVHYAIRPKNLLRRKYGELFFQKIEEVLNKVVVNNKVDFILHSGDLFNRSKPPSEVISRAIHLFLTILQKGIKIYIIPGNHERSFLPIGLLKLHPNIHVFDRASVQFFEKNDIRVKITGIPYIRRNAVDRFPKLVNSVEQHLCNSVDGSEKITETNLNNLSYSILLAHQIIEGARLENYTFLKGSNVIKFNTLDKQYDYIALGHVHRFQWMYQNNGKIISINDKFSVNQSLNNRDWNFKEEQQVHSGPLVAYAGSIERVSFTEMNEPKGFILGELNNFNGIMKGNFRFINHNGIEMRSYLWDPNSMNQEKFMELIQEEFKLLKQGKTQESINGILKIKIVNDIHPIPKTLVSELKTLAIKHNVLLSFIFPMKRKEDEKKDFST